MATWFENICWFFLKSFSLFLCTREWIIPICVHKGFVLALGSIKHNLKREYIRYGVIKECIIWPLLSVSSCASSTEHYDSGSNGLLIQFTFSLIMRIGFWFLTFLVLLNFVQLNLEVKESQLFQLCTCLFPLVKAENAQSKAHGEWI